MRGSIDVFVVSAAVSVDVLFGGCLYSNPAPRLSLSDGVQSAVPCTGIHGVDSSPVLLGVTHDCHPRERRNVRETILKNVRPSIMNGDRNSDFIGGYPVYRDLLG